MSSSPLAAPPDGGDLALHVASTGAPGETRAPTAPVEKAQSIAAKPAQKGDEELEHGWTGLGLPAFDENEAKAASALAESAQSVHIEEKANVHTAPSVHIAPAVNEGISAPPVAPAAPTAAPNAPSAEPPAPPLAPAAAAATTTVQNAPSAEPANPAPVPAPAEPAKPAPVPAPPNLLAKTGPNAAVSFSKSGSTPAALPPRPTGRSGAFPAVAPPRPAGAPGSPPAAPARPSGQSGAFPAVAPPQATGRSGAFPAVAPPQPTGRSGAFPAVAPERISALPGERSSASSPPPPAPQKVAPASLPPLPAPQKAAPASPPPPAPEKPAQPAVAPTFAAASAPAIRAESPAPASSDEHEVTLEDEGELGATIPDNGPQFLQDLFATVPMLPLPVAAPSFGLPPPNPPHPAAAAPSAVAAEPPASAPRAAIPPPALDAVETTSDAGPPPYGAGSIIADKYKLINVIGRGGMGAVWVAHNTALDVDVAVKLMRRDRASPEATARFTTEARAAAKLGHPSIVRVFDFGETSRGDPFIVMELLRGESFASLLARKKKLNPTVAVQTLLPVAHALAAAHAKGIVHRDLKPDNILLAKDESGVLTPKVVDFGIAKLVSADVDRHFTIAGEVLGSPDYMSPEQARGEDDIDHRTDIWTFSVLLYEAIGGRRPFDGANYNALLAAIIASRPTPLTDLGACDATLWSVIEKGLAKERDARWQSVREMAMELARWAIEKGADHDLVGASLSAQWLEPTRRRLFTVAGSGPPADPPAAAQSTDPVIPPPPPLGNLAADVPKTAALATANTMPPFVPRRRPWVALGIAVVIAGGIGAALLLGAFSGPPSPDPSASSASPAASPEPSASAASSASATAALSASASTKPSASSTAKPKSTFTGKPKAPQVKGPIKF
ncbi:MAG: serine/threonine protein kinase [Polyangiaceae bacterium]|nr:serine/threonine protein kinase [Polyangiaceae bacterium]